MCLQVGFNVELGGYFSIKRNATSINGDTWLDVEEVAPYCKAILETFRYSLQAGIYMLYVHICYMCCMIC